MHLPDFDFTKLLDWGFLGIASKFAARISGSIDKLNIHIAQLLERTEQHGKEIGNHENRIEHLERKKR